LKPRTRARNRNWTNAGSGPGIETGQRRPAVTTVQFRSCSVHICSVSC